MSSQRVEVPAREGRAVRMEANQRFQIVDTEGQQVVDLFAFVAQDVSEYASAEHTRVALGRLFPRVGETFVTNRRRPILAFERDHSPGIHDMLCAACDPTRYELLGATGPHASCQENLLEAMAGLGYGRVEVPQPINLFMNTPALPDGTIVFRAAETRPGDLVELRAMVDVVVVVSACPMDMNPINSGQPKGVAIELLA